jgi:phosphoribosyl 1,2-cyclic phosphodiesterase
MQKCGFNLSSVDGVLITHCHKDHSKAISGLSAYGIPIYLSHGTKDALGASYSNIREVTALKQFPVRTFSILPFDVEHDAPEPLGFLCTSTATGEKLLYFTDTFYLKYTFSGLTHIMGECNYTKSALDEAVAAGHTRWERVQRLAKSHMSLETFLEFLRSNDLSRLRQVYLLHMSADNSDAETMRRAVQKETGVEVYIC